MNLFYTTTIDGQMASLPEEEARHCIQALRHKVGDIIHITDASLACGWLSQDSFTTYFSCNCNES